VNNSWKTPETKRIYIFWLWFERGSPPSV